MSKSVTKGRKKKLQEIERRLRKEFKRTSPDDLGTLGDPATLGGGGEPLGSTFVGPERRIKAEGLASPKRTPRKARKAA